MTVVVALAITAGLCASAAHAAQHRRRIRYLDAIVAAIREKPDATVWDIADALKLSAFKAGSVYAELDLLERRGQITSRWDAQAKRMHWSVKGGA